MPRWLLPENISDVLPSEARRMEELRRRLLDLYRSYGYELVVPPMIEHIDSLLTGSGRDLGLRTFQLVDQLSGRTLGVRADITPQVARIDAHLLNRSGVARLCYAGSVLHTRAASPFATREPMQVGAELYGHAGLEADLEVIELLVRSLDAADCRRLRIDLCHVGIVPALLSLHGPVPGLDTEDLYALLQGKDVPGLAEALEPAPAGLRDALLALPGLHGRIAIGGKEGATPPAGDAGPLARARRLLPQVGPVSEALDRLERLAASPMWRRWPGVEVSIDLADLRGYRYHNGITFAAYVEALPFAVARGGRYDDAGRVFGRARPATGFSLELRALADLQPEQPPARAIAAPWSDDPALADAIAGLRAAGEIVIQSLPGSERDQQEFTCDRELATDDAGRWIVRALTQE
ncbi:ATP phosphoribosyltransferase regulatory subunit [Burkholderiaceae bacterium FT117]|uniref:ATP phosphoribosyltransferase regulatory subunit n=1 Tax=Zeimonas sediminis TaxID=2944268 RepID=UPI002342E13E|nr:ATP phosphoribosyltransferase regulatory subunit [Zeimonas sediminis]MCM5571924.1 ATP phosphoribosyltransferase regulatory subunit [Zeimonas sediminis]